MEQAFKYLIAVPVSNQMFVVTVLCIIGFGWVFVKVLNKQTDILMDIKLVMTRQVDNEVQRINIIDKLAEAVVNLAQQLALHRQVTEPQHWNGQERRNP